MGPKPVRSQRRLAYKGMNSIVSSAVFIGAKLSPLP
jgi:hypothetical protein